MPKITWPHVAALAVILGFVLAQDALDAKKDIKVHSPFGGGVEVTTPTSPNPVSSGAPK